MGLSLKELSMSGEESWRQYRELYRECFGRNMPDSHIPGVLYLAFDHGSLVGFVAGYVHDRNTFYIQYLGIKRKLHGDRRAVGYWKDVEAFLQSLGYLFLLGTVEAQNTPTLITALHGGWMLRGMQADTDGCLYANIFRDLREKE